MDSAEAGSRRSGRDPRVVIVGAGMSGVLMGIMLKRAGVETFEIFEKGPAIGGTWRDNTYPGLACDVPAYMYTYKFEPNTDWSHRFARGPEIQQYFEGVYAKYGLEKYVRCSKEVLSSVYEDGAWTVTTKDGQTTRADIVISAAGILHHPSHPEIEGLETFQGPRFHSARWDHGVDLKDKRVGIIGTGSTAAQIVSALAGKVRKLSLFQRTAQWIHPQYDTGYSEWSKRLLRRLPWLASLFHRLYSFFFGITFARVAVNDPKIMGPVGWNCRRMLATVKDPELRRKLTPNYSPGCKRLIFADDFYTAIQHPTSELVTEGIARIEPEGIRTRDGRLHELDVLVTATGFKAHSYMRPMKVIGAKGLDLDAVWAKGASAHRSVAIPGFPNFFMMIGPHSPIGNFSVIAISESQAAYIMSFVELFRRGQCTRMEARADAAARYNDDMRGAIKETVWVRGGCQSWYLDQSGLPALWPWTFTRFRNEMKTPLLEEFELTTPRS
jgi:cation diffusion facilitator CzcD-associated flavoprotein CzcO